MRRETKLLVPAVVVVVAVAFLAFVLHYVPFDAPSFLANGDAALRTFAGY
jgi:hypothetical protein